MKSWIKWVVERLVRYDLAWCFLNRLFIRNAEFVKAARRSYRLGSSVGKQDYNTACDAILDGLTVLSGPFQGMRYSQGRSTGSALVPKILGCYERELHQVFEEVFHDDYSVIVDIGCAEGYYAVGLALRIPSAQVYAFDIDHNAQKLCREMSLINGVSDRISVNALCDFEALGKIPFGKKAFIISDCEGYERQLFTAELLPQLMHHDLLIEVHDFIDPTTSSYLWDLFVKTHVIHVIESVSDVAKAHTYFSSKVCDCSLNVRRQLFAENRPTIMEWFFLKSRF